MSKTRPILDKSLIDKIIAIKPKYITTNGFINMLLEDAYNDRVNKNANLTNNIDYIYTDNKELEDKKLERKEQKEKINKKEKQEKIVPDDLKHIESLILEFWKSKKGAKTVEAWKRQNTEYRKFIQKYGDDVLKDQLDAGILAGTWKGCTIKNYEEQKQRMNRFNKESEQTSIHPNQKVAEFDEFGRLI
jgi:glutamate synthase domain-containing protein 3